MSIHCTHKQSAAYLFHLRHTFPKILCFFYHCYATFSAQRYVPITDARSQIFKVYVSNRHNRESNTLIPAAQTYSWIFLAMTPVAQKILGNVVKELSFHTNLYECELWTVWCNFRPYEIYSKLMGQGNLIVTLPRVMRLS